MIAIRFYKTFQISTKNLALIQLIAINIALLGLMSTSSNALAYQIGKVDTTQLARLEQQRKQFPSALASAKKGQKIDLASYARTFEDYPLYPYLEYYYLLNYINSRPLSEYEAFFKQYPDLASANFLRKKLLLRLGGKGDWLNFERFYDNYDDSIEIECLYIESQIALKGDNNKNEWLGKVENIWNTGESLPDECDSVVSLFKEAGQLSQALILNRIRLAIGKRKFSLARYLSKKLDEDHKKEYELWDDLSSNPKLLINDDSKYKDTAFTRFAISYALLKLLKEDPPMVLTLWKEFQTKLSYKQEEIHKFTEKAAISLIKRRSDHTLAWLEAANPKHHNAELNLKELVIHIKNNDWPQIIKIYGELSKSEKEESIWQYWYARSHIEYDRNDSIHPNIFQLLNTLSQKRNYYGFLASFHLSSTPFISKHNFPVKDADLNRINQIKGIKRAQEFYLLDEYISASREWEFTVKKLPKSERGLAAILASQWGWDEQAIRSASSSSQFDNMRLRFPLSYARTVNFNAGKYYIPNEWVFSIIRQESAYSYRAESRVGALGLMQIMPNTAKALARQTNRKRFKTSDLYNPETNIELGTFYLNELRGQFGGNMMLASAAYNAGPSRVRSWKKGYEGQPIEFWIESIPFEETRNYVKNVMTYMIIYQRELGRETNASQLFLPVPE